MEQAFVAMNFSGPASQDRWYALIKATLEEAGYSTIRADEISTSGAVVDEVCRFLREAPLVVIDSTHDSHSVSYEIGYCHGVGRTPETTLLLRKSPKIPFNYSHFRHQIYKSPAGLCSVIRAFLGLSEPLSDSQVSYAASFKVLDDSMVISSDSIAECILATAKHFRLTARLETYTKDGFIRMRFTDHSVSVSTRKTPASGADRIFTYGIAITPPARGRPTPDVEDFSEFLSDQIHRREPHLLPAPSLSEAGTLRFLRSSLSRFAFADFLNGTPRRFVYPHQNPLAPNGPATA